MKNIKQHAPKFLKILEIIKKHEGEKGYIYSQFLDSGIIPLKRFLLTQGYNEFSIHDQVKCKNLCVLSGSVDDTLKQQYIDIFNSDMNNKGEYIQLLLITSAVSQGISLIGMRYVIILEPYWNWTRIKQIMDNIDPNDTYTVLEFYPINELLIIDTKKALELDKNIYF